MTKLNQKSSLELKHRNRRWFLGQCGVGLGSVALSQLLGEIGLSTVDSLQVDTTSLKQRRLSSFLWLELLVTWNFLTISLS